MLRVRLTPAAARASSSALSVVAAGRPPCPLCGQPLDPHGHICPRERPLRQLTPDRANDSAAMPIDTPRRSTSCATARSRSSAG